VTLTRNDDGEIVIDGPADSLVFVGYPFSKADGFALGLTHLGHDPVTDCDVFEARSK